MSDGVCREQAYAADDPGRHCLESQPSSRTGENPPYGMIGGIEETSASFEARSAPRSYPTPITGLMHRSKQHLHSSTSSARPSNGSGMVRPSALAVLRLMTSSAFVDS